jgi:hypothetical protein
MRPSSFVFASAFAILSSSPSEAETLFTSDQWEVSSEVLAGDSACVLTFTGTKFLVRAIAIKGNSALVFNYPGWKFRKRLAAAALATGEVTPAEGGGFVATGTVILDPHSAFEGDEVNLEVGWQPVPQDLVEMSKSQQPASLVDEDGRVLLKWALKDGKKPIKVWSNCADRL